MMNMREFSQAFSQFRQNPMGFMMARKLNIPPEYQNDYKGAVQYLLNTGQMSQDQLNALLTQARQIQQDPNFHP